VGYILEYTYDVRAHDVTLKISITCKLTYVVVSSREVQNSPLVQPPAHFPRPVTPPPPRILAYPVILCDGTRRNAISTFELTVMH
jgi:hypothetical protein